MAGTALTFATGLGRRMLAPLRHLWSRTSLFVRLASVVTGFMGVGALLIFSLLIRNDIQSNAAELWNQAAREVEMLASLLTESAILGDYATIDQTLQRFSQHDGIAEAVWTPTSGKPLVVTAPPEIYPGADLIHSWLALPEPVERWNITVGGRNYGEVRLHLSARSREHEIVSEIGTCFALLILSNGGMLLCLMVVLRQALDPLKELDTRVRQIEAGEAATDLRPLGSPEVRRLIGAFNAMHRAQRASYEDLERFAEVLAHHLQEPVRLQYAFAQRLQLQMPAGAPDSALTSLAYILKGALRLRALIRDVQLFLALKHLKPSAIPCETKAAFAVAHAEFAARLAELGATVDVGPLPPLCMDKSRLVDVFRALIDNAIEYRRPDTPLHLRVSAESTETQVVVILCDNGMGIPPEYRNRVFKVFERLHSNTEHPGTGIGLSLVRKIIEAAHGTVTLADGEDGGVSVRLTFGSGME